MHESQSSRTLAALTAIVLRWRIVVPFALVTPFVVLVLTMRSPSIYESTADVLLDRNGQAVSGLRDATFYDPSRTMRTQVELARLPEVRNRARDAAERQGLRTSGYRVQTSVSEDGVTDLMTFHVRASDAELAASLATIYAEEYVAHRRELDTRSLRAAIAVIDVQLRRARAAGLDSEAYAELVRQQQRLQVGLGTLESNARVVRPAVGARHVSPRVLDDALAGLLLGLVVGLGLAALASFLDTRARSVWEISDRLGFPVLARVPLRPRRVRSPLGGLRAETASSTPADDALGLLRANLELELRGHERPVVLVTSSVAGEGKSTTAADLAHSYALTGRSVVLVDLDLSRPVLWRRFDLPRAPGIAEVARGLATLAEAIHTVELDDASGREPVALRVVTAGNTLAASKEEVLGDPRLGEALVALRGDADLVVVDAPPLLGSGDTLAVAPFLDGVLLVARMSAYRTSYGPELLRLLARTRTPVLGLVVLGTPRELGAPAGRKRRERELRAETPALGPT